MADKKYIARIPIVPDDFVNQDTHKDRELVMDFEKSDIYVKKGDGYVNITGKIKDDIKQIKDGSAVINVVTEQSLPPVKERPENAWYFVVTSATTESGDVVSTSSYIYFGLIDTYHTNKSYLLIAQNVMEGSGSVNMEILDGYGPCFYIPVNYSASFTNHDTGETIPFTIEDRLYAMNSLTGSFTAYDVYTLELYDPGTYTIDLDLTGSDKFTISFDTNEPSIEGLVLPESIKVNDEYCIGEIPDPTWDDPRFIFKGWSTSKISESIINTLTYKPEDNMTLFAWFDYDDDPTSIAYYATYVSNEGGTDNE